MINPVQAGEAVALQAATFSIGCFWGYEALFGSVAGVVQTRVGYAGGSTPYPTYHALADHIETVQLKFNPAQISYAELIQLFFRSHTSTQPAYKRQYTSAVFYHDPAQEKLARAAKVELELEKGTPSYTVLYPYTQFYLAENRHQKYKLQRQQKLLQEFEAMHPDFEAIINATAAARVNGYLGGYGSIETLEEEIGEFGLSPTGQRLLLQETAKFSHNKRSS